MCWSLTTLQDRDRVLQRLTQQKLSLRAAQMKAALFARAAAALQASGTAADTAAVACFVPGRIEVLGKHTDYAGGRSLVAAVQCGICLVAVADSQQHIAVTDVVMDQSDEFPFLPDMQPRQGHWSNYPMTVARRIARNFDAPLSGARIAFGSDLPLAAGMSSSSALVIAVFWALAAINDLPARDNYQQNIHRCEDLAGYLATIENGQNYGSLTGDHGVGTFGGSEDHTAILCAHAGNMSQYSYCPIEFERFVPLPEDFSFVMAISGVVAEKTKAAMAKYNRMSRLAAAVAETWRRSTGRTDPHLAAALQSIPDAAERMRNVLRQARHPEFEVSELLDRFEQFHTESELIIPRVQVPLIGPALKDFGTLVDQSQRFGAQQLKNQVPETVFLADRAPAWCCRGLCVRSRVWWQRLGTRGNGPIGGLRSGLARGVLEVLSRALSGATCIVSGAGPAAFSFTASESLICS